MTQRLKILISSYACSPVWGSEPGMGWNFVTAIAKHHDVWVITEKEKFQEEVEVALRNIPELSDSIRFFFIAKKRHRRLRRFWPPSYYWFYRTWHKEAFDLACSLHHEINFDLVHQLNMVGFREPGYLWKLGVPFVWGPVGGMNQFPWRFLGSIGIGGAVHHFGRNILNAYHRRFLKRPQMAAKKANQGLIAATSQMQEVMRKLWFVESRVIPEIGRLDTSANKVRERMPGHPLKIAWSGLHIPRKALPLLLRSLALLDTSVDWRLNILGQGPLTKKWMSLANKLGVVQNCTWLGWLPTSQAVKRMEEAHMFVITSLHDLTSTVMLEALSLGLPIICLDHCGFSDVVTEECGMKIPVGSPKQVITEIASAIELLWNDEDYRQRLAYGALERATYYSWERKMANLNEIYAAVLSESKMRATMQR